jgi:hypothetical protein
MNAVHGRARCENRPCWTLVMTFGRTFLFGPASVLGRCRALRCAGFFGVLGRAGKQTEDTRDSRVMG